LVGVGVGVGVGFAVGDVVGEAVGEPVGVADGDVVGEAVALADGELDAVADPVTDGVGEGELVARAALGAAAIKAIPAAVATMARSLLMRASFLVPLPAARSCGAAGGTARLARRRRATGRW
jgi:hypothetical protein